MGELDCAGVSEMRGAELERAERRKHPFLCGMSVEDSALYRGSRGRLVVMG